MSLNQEIQKARRKKGLTQIYVAEKADMSNNRLSRIELGYSQPNTEELIAIAIALGEKANFFTDKVLDTKIKSMKGLKEV